MGKENIPLRLATSNAGKRGQFKKHSEQYDLGTVDVLFDEERIKEQITTRGLFEVVDISLGKLKEQRVRLNEVEQDDKDYEILVSDSVIVVPMQTETGVEYKALQKEQEDKDELLAEINKQGHMIFVGAVSFGRKKGASAFTILTYCDCPIPQENPVTSFPMDMETVRENAVKSGLEFEVGYIECVEEEGDFKLQKRPVTRTHLFEKEGDVPDTGVEARPYISGLTPEVIALAERTGRMDKEVSPVIEEMVGSHPFNTLTYYALYEQAGRPQDIVAFYQSVVDESERFFCNHGGNCSLFTLELIRKLKEQSIDHSVVLYPSLPDSLNRDGHSALLLVDQDGKKYLADPGLTIPWIIPVDDKTPLFPFNRVGDKRVLVQVDDENGDGLPDMTMIGGRRLQRFNATEQVSSDSFIVRLPSILASLHGERNDLKFDVHGNRGEKRVDITISRANGTLKIRNGVVVAEMSLEAFLQDKGLLEKTDSIFQENGVCWEAVLEEIRLVANTQVQ